MTICDQIHDVVERVRFKYRTSHRLRYTIDFLAAGFLTVTGLYLALHGWYYSAAGLPDTATSCFALAVVDLAPVTAALLHDHVIPLLDGYVSP